MIGIEKIKEMRKITSDLINENKEFWGKSDECFRRLCEIKGGLDVLLSKLEKENSVDKTKGLNS